MSFPAAPRAASIIVIAGPRVLCTKLANTQTVFGALIWQRIIFSFELNCLPVDFGKWVAQQCEMAEKCCDLLRWRNQNERN